MLIFEKREKLQYVEKNFSDHAEKSANSKILSQ